MQARLRDAAGMPRGASDSPAAGLRDADGAGAGVGDVDLSAISGREFAECVFSMDFDCKSFGLLTRTMARKHFAQRATCPSNPTLSSAAQCGSSDAAATLAASQHQIRILDSVSTQTQASFSRCTSVLDSENLV